MAEEFDAQIRHNPLADKSQQVGTDKVKQALQQEYGNQDQRNLVQQRGVVLFKYRIDQVLQGIRPGKPQQTTHHNSHHRHVQVEPVRSDKLKHPLELIQALNRVFNSFLFCRLDAHTTPFSFL